MTVTTHRRMVATEPDRRHGHGDMPAYDESSGLWFTGQNRWAPVSVEDGSGGWELVFDDDGNVLMVELFDRPAVVLAGTLPPLGTGGLG